MKVEWFPGENGKTYWHLVGRNAQVISTSQGYTTAWSCRRTAKKLAKILGVPLVHGTGATEWPQD